MITFKPKPKRSFSFKIKLGAVSASFGDADGELAFLIKIVSDDGVESHKILLSLEAAFALAALIQVCGADPEPEMWEQLKMQS